MGIRWEQGGVEVGGRWEDAMSVYVHKYVLQYIQTGWALHINCFL